MAGQLLPPSTAIQARTPFLSLCPSHPARKGWGETGGGGDLPTITPAADTATFQPREQGRTEKRKAKT